MGSESAQLAAINSSTQEESALISEHERSKKSPLTRRRRQPSDHIYWGSALTFTFVLLLLIFSVMDAVITLSLLDTNCEEINPVMRRLLNMGLFHFMVGKYVLTAAGLPVLLIFQDRHLFGTRFRVGYLIPIFVGLYVILLAYEYWLLEITGTSSF